MGSYECGKYSIGINTNVNFKILAADFKVEAKYIALLKENKISENDLKEYIDKYNNVVKEMNIKWCVIKD